MKLELEGILGRDVDLLNRRALEKTRNRSRTAQILAEAKSVYAQS
jgi:predicted nucleotidyltransferase